MAEQNAQIDRLLATALGEGRAPWPQDWQGAEVKAAATERLLYHGISGLLAERSDRLKDWPADVVAALRQQAIAQAMWEMRHRIVVAELLTALDRDAIVAIILKGTAFAYDLYDAPATRARGDSDILIARDELSRTRARLHEMGFRTVANDGVDDDDLRLQEVWQLTAADGTDHNIDLHWQALNSLALRDALTFADCSARLLPLPRLCDAALTMDRVTGLIYACMHRAQHIVSPYFVDDVTYYGGDRLIWAYDLHLLAKAFLPQDWVRLCDMALDKGVADICLDGLTTAQARLGTAIPADVIGRLKAAPPGGKTSTYLLGSGQAGRAWMDLRAVPGLRPKLAYLIGRILPSHAYIRAKYPDISDRPLVRLYLRRLAEFLRKRPERSGR